MADSVFHGVPSIINKSGSNPSTLLAKEMSIYSDNGTVLSVNIREADISIDSANNGISLA